MTAEITKEQLLELIKSKRLQLTLDMYSWEEDVEANAKIVFDGETLDSDRKSTRLNSSHSAKSRMPSSA